MMASQKVASSRVAANCFVIAEFRNTLHFPEFARLGSGDCRLALGILTFRWWIDLDEPFRQKKLAKNP